jgi:hypothetical protein
MWRLMLPDIPWDTSWRLLTCLAYFHNCRPFMIHEKACGGPSAGMYFLSTANADLATTKRYSEISTLSDFEGCSASQSEKYIRPCASNRNFKVAARAMNSLLSIYTTPLCNQIFNIPPKHMLLGITNSPRRHGLPLVFITIKGLGAVLWPAACPCDFLCGLRLGKSREVFRL